MYDWLIRLHKILNPFLNITKKSRHKQVLKKVFNLSRRQQIYKQTGYLHNIKNLPPKSIHYFKIKSSRLKLSIYLYLCKTFSPPEITLQLRDELLMWFQIAPVFFKNYQSITNYYKASFLINLTLSVNYAYENVLFFLVHFSI